MGKRTSKAGSVERSQYRRGSISGEQIEKLVEMAPRFEVLAEVAQSQGEERELTQKQQTFLDDFEAKLTQGLADSDMDAEDRTS